MMQSTKSSDNSRLRATKSRNEPQVFRPATANSGAPAAYKPSANGLPIQPKAANNFRLETRAAPPAYRPQQASVSPQPKMPAASLQPQSQYELSAPVWIGNGRQQIRVKAKGAPTPVGSVDLHLKEHGKAFISDLQVSQSHRQHGLGSMLMKAALDSARRQGSAATELEANPGPGSISKQALVSMYQKLGFSNVGFTRRGNPKMSTHRPSQGAAPSATQLKRVAPSIHQ